VDELPVDLLAQRGRPERIVQALERRSPQRCLHRRRFLDHKRTDCPDQNDEHEESESDDATDVFRQDSQRRDDFQLERVDPPLFPCPTRNRGRTIEQVVLSDTTVGAALVRFRRFHARHLP
jgi:hypothetical protein